MTVRSSVDLTGGAGGSSESWREKLSRLVNGRSLADCVFATLAEFEAHAAVPCLETRNLALSRQVDEVDRDGAVARSKADAPEIDGVVRIDDGQELKPGQFAEVDIVHADEHDLMARLAS